METAQLVVRILLAALFLGMGVSHFVPKVARGMAAMIPRLPARRALVRITGVCEIAGAIGLLAPWELLRLITGIALAVFLVAVFPANAYAAGHPEKFGRAATPFWPRLGLQLLLIAAVLVSTVPLGTS